ncbi:MAG TPA: hypothetical protein VEO75_02485 [Nitrososphaerales archaeon]|nr:hypothetical protein [Nitrososphaerales archaeon]
MSSIIAAVRDGCWRQPRIIATPAAKIVNPIQFGIVVSLSLLRH